MARDNLDPTRQATPVQRLQLTAAPRPDSPAQRRSTWGPTALVAAAAVGVVALSLGYGPSSEPERLAAAAPPDAALVEQTPAIRSEDGPGQANAEALREDLQATLSELLPGEAQAGSVNWATTETTSGPSDNVLATATWQDASGSVTFYATRTSAVTQTVQGLCEGPSETKAALKCSAVAVRGKQKPAKLYTSPDGRRTERGAVVFLDDGSTVRVVQRAGAIDELPPGVKGEDAKIKVSKKRVALPLSDKELTALADSLAQ